MTLLLASRAAAATARVASRHFSRTFVSATSVLQNDLPYHLVVGLPALSPTMESGALAEWYVAEGDSFMAGDAIAKIETDKASVDFEAQDDGFVAKFLLEAGTGQDVPVGTPMMITVEEADHVSAFKDYVVEKTEKASSPAAASSPPPAAKAAPPQPPAAPATEAKVQEAPKPAEPVVAAPAAPPTPAAVPPPAAAASTAPVTGSFSTAWGLSVNRTSPLAKTLASKQKLYVELYGTTGQRPIL